MQRYSPWWLLAWIIFPLYGTPAAFSSEILVAPTPEVQAPRVPQPAPSAGTDKSAAQLQTTPPELEKRTEPPGAVSHLALLLPLDSPSFGRAAEVVHQGFAAAAKSQGGLALVRTYGTTDAVSDILAAYQRAFADGAKLVVGPLTRNAVSALAASGDVKVPTLALNMAKGEIPVPRNLYFFSLQVEAEARQVARLAASEKLRSAVVVSGDSPIEKRILQAFAGEWTRQGGTIMLELAFTGDTAALATLRHKVNAMPETILFLALEESKARLAAPYLDPAISTYATSQVFSGNDNVLANFDLNGIRFVDMPWMVQPDHAAVMIYPRADPPLAAGLERLYALGIDAFRLAQFLLRNQTLERLSLDGVSGRISLGHGHQFLRELTSARFRDGQARVQEALSGGQ